MEGTKCPTSRLRTEVPQEADREAAPWLAPSLGGGGRQTSWAGPSGEDKPARELALGPTVGRYLCIQPLGPVANTLLMWGPYCTPDPWGCCKALPATQNLCLGSTNGRESDCR